MHIQKAHGDAKPANSEPIFRAPKREDGAAVWRLIGECSPLDENSMYCNLLQCDHFGDTCIVTELDGEVVGWVSGYIVPSEPDTLFVWQVAVSDTARGKGVGKRMLSALVRRPACADVTKLKTTITADNKASWALFEAFADAMEAPLTRTPHFERDAHFRGSQATEYMVTVGTFGSRQSKAA